MNSGRAVKKVFQVFLVVVCVFAFSEAVAACMCTNQTTALSAYDKAANVVILRVVSIEKPRPQQEERSGSDGTDDKSSEVRTVNDLLRRVVTQVAKLEVERVFKGPLKVGDVVTYEATTNTCTPGFKKEEVGRRVLDYLREYKPGTTYGLDSCMRNNSVGPENPDIRFLENMEKFRGRTRVSGTVTQYVYSPYKDVDYKYIRKSGKKVRIVGEDDVYEAVTDEFGVFEIYDVKPGKYDVIPEMIEGFKVRVWSAPRGMAFAGRRGQPKTRYQVTVVPESHAEIGIGHSIENRVSGVFQDSMGKAMNNVCVQLNPVGGERKRHISGASDCTSANGEFKLEGIPEGQYVLVVNNDDVIYPSMPFRKFYYPGVRDRAKASVISIVPGIFLDDITISPMETVETVRVSGRLLFSDDVPVDGKSMFASIIFIPKDTKPDKYGRRWVTARAPVGTDGRFSFEVLKGIEGVLQVKMFSYKGRFENCPAYEVLAADPKRQQSILKDDYPMMADRQLLNVELRMPMPFCKEKKIR